MRWLVLYNILSVATFIKLTASSLTNHDNSKQASDLLRFQSNAIQMKEMNLLMTQHKEKIELQSLILERQAETLADINRKFHDIEEFIKFIRNLQGSQYSNYDNLVNDARILEEQMQHELAEKDARIAQLEYRIRKIHRRSPYVEKYNFPIYKFWVAVDLVGKNSDWSFNNENTSGRESEICQKKDLHSENTPATLLVLKSHELDEGFVFSEIKLQSDAFSVRGKAAAGLVFFFTSKNSYWMVELSKISSQSLLSISKVSESVVTKIADAPVNVESDTYYKLASRFTPNFISIFLDGVPQLEVDLSSSSSTLLGTVGLFTRIGKASFKNFISASSFFEKFVPEGAFEVVIENSPPKTRKITNEEELRMLRSKDVQFRQLEPHDNQSVDSGVAQLARTFTNIKDYLDQDIKAKRDFLPDSSIHVPDQESTLVVDNVYRSFPEISGNRSISIVPASSCQYFRKPNLDMNDWVITNDSHWVITNELGTQRLTIPDALKVPQSLLLKNYLCNSVIIKAKMKLLYNSEGGIIFRAADKLNSYSVTYNTNTMTIQLEHEQNGVIKILQKVQKNILKGQINHSITIVDHGRVDNGFIEVYIDDEGVITYPTGLYEGFGSMGLLLRFGHGDFDSFEIIPLEMPIFA